MRTLFCSLLLCVQMLGLSASHAAERTIEVTGTATTRAPVDILTWSISIRSMKDTLPEAASATGEAFALLENKLKALEIPELQMFSTDVESGREYSREDGYTFPGKMIGFYSEQQLRITMPKSPKSADVQAALLSDERFSISSYTGRTSRELEIKKQALRDAAVAAREKAESIAEAMGVKLGTVTRIAEGSDRGVIVSSNVMHDTDRPGTVSGELEDVSVSQTVSVQFELQ